MDIMTEIPVQAIDWKRWQRYLFRFWGLYFVLYFYSLPILNFLWEPVVEWAGLVMNITLPDQGPNGSGDTTFNYVQLICLAIISLAGCLSWSALSTRKQYNTLFAWTITLVRYALVFYMFSYGLAKIALMQMPSPSLLRLMQPYGESSPMGLAWTFVGASPAFSIFTGTVEVLGGLLLLFRRTTVFGTLFSMTVIANILVMNLCYDIPVKLFSMHLLAACVFIISPFISQVWNFFFTGRAVVAKKYTPVFIKHPLARTISKLLVGVGLGFLMLNNLNDRNTAKPVLYGIYNVDVFIMDGDTLAALMTDTNRWQFITVDKWNRGAIKKMGVPADRYGLEVSAKKSTMRYKTEDSSWLLQYQVPDSNHLIVNGRIAGHYIYSVLSKKDLKDFQLINRGFHWINEAPYNR